MVLQKNAKISAIYYLQLLKTIVALEIHVQVCVPSTVMKDIEDEVHIIGSSVKSLR